MTTREVRRVDRLLRTIEGGRPTQASLVPSVVSALIMISITGVLVAVGSWLLLPTLPATPQRNAHTAAGSHEWQSVDAQAAYAFTLIRANLSAESQD